MNGQVQVLALPSRIVRVAAIATPAVFIIVVGVATIGPSVQTTIPFALGGIVCGLTLWLELRSPRSVIFTDGAMELRAAAGSVVIRDGEVVSLFVAPVGRVYPGGPPRRVVLRFKGGRRAFDTAFSGFQALVEELRSRNPQASILPDD